MIFRVYFKYTYTYLLLAMTNPQLTIGQAISDILTRKKRPRDEDYQDTYCYDDNNSFRLNRDIMASKMPYKRRNKIEIDWSEKQTDEFYDALSETGIDLRSMQKILPIYTQNQLYHKIMREKIFNPERVDKALADSVVYKARMEEVKKGIEVDWMEMI